FQVTPKASHLHVVKRIFRYLKHRDSPFELEAFSDSDYVGANLDRKSTTDGCQFLGRRLISWQCKKQTVMENSTTEAEYVAAAHCCAQVLLIQYQKMDYDVNFMNTKIHIDNESTICVVKNPVYHSRTKHIEIRHHFIRDCYEKRLIDVLKIHTDSNVVDLLIKGFDVTKISMDLRMDRCSAGKFYSYMVCDDSDDLCSFTVFRVLPTDFMKCQPFEFKGTKGICGLCLKGCKSDESLFRQLAVESMNKSREVSTALC
ncbi:hypothetical protein Tco_1299362, partial [Tanacetum coccineum]